MSTNKMHTQKNHGIILQASMPQHSQISEFFLVGSLDMAIIKSQIESLNKAGDDIYPVMQQCLVKSIARFLKQKKKEDQVESEMEL